MILKGAGPYLQNAGLPLRLALPGGQALDFGPEPCVTFHLHRHDVLYGLLHGDVDRLAQAYVEGELSIEASLQDAIQVGIALAEKLEGLARFKRRVFEPYHRLEALLTSWRWRHSHAEDKAWVGYHYDVSNEFYRLWLDRRMVYSCAYFETGTEDIDAAQEAKLDLICRKLRLSPGERLLDIGCGWGGLLAWAASRYGVKGVGVTLSREQYDHACALMRQEGLDGRVEIRLQDYREIPGEGGFDKIVSVGMYEHVGRSNHPVYFATIRRLLKEEGLLLNHGITTSNPAGGSSGPAGGDFINRYVFPGGELSHIGQVLAELGRADFDVLDVESLRPHYAMTLLHWLRRLESRRDEVIAVAGETRYRIWRLYMAGCALAFERNWMAVYQVVAGKPDGKGRLTRPWTRKHVYGIEAEPLLAPPPDWEGL